MRTLSEWEAYIETLHPRSMVLGLERVQRVLARLPRPADPLVITVAGTNGKGSCVACLEAILGMAGYRTGAYTSPHLMRYNERVRIAGGEAPDALLCQAFETVEAAREGEPLTYFEFGTLAALVAMWSERVEVLLLEVGMGGRLDAVNVLDADAAVVTSVGLDHTRWLGTTREAIGREKAGIFRPGRSAVCGPGCPETVTGPARALGRPALIFGRDFGWQAHGRSWRWWGPDGHLDALPVPLPGRHQLDNAACALAALQGLAGRLDVSAAAVRRGLEAVRLPGRFQVLPGPPQRILDVAHNPDAAAGLACTLAGHPVAGRTLAVCAMLADKDHAGVFTALAGDVDGWYLADLKGERAARAETLAAALDRVRPAAPCRQFDAVEAAWSAALQDAGPSDRVLGLGSFYTVAAIMRAFEPPPVRRAC